MTDAASDPISVPFLDAANGRQPDRTPVWFMRQAGRSLPEYKGVRGEGSILGRMGGIGGFFDGN